MLSEPSPDPLAPDTQIDRLLKVAYQQLGLDASFIGRFDGDERELRNVASSVPVPVGVGFREPRELTHCQGVVDGRFPEVMQDTMLVPGAGELPGTTMLGVRSLVSVPVLRADGSAYGTLCAVGFQPDASLRDRDARVLQALAAVISTLVEDGDRERQRSLDITRRLSLLAASGGLRVVFQPIVDTVSGRVVGHEALSRFPAELGRDPAQWFADAAAVGRGVELELDAIRCGLTGLHCGDGYVSVNASPPTVLDPRLGELLGAHPLERVVLELTEHDQVDDYALVRAALAPLRERGMAVAVDDTGAGYASLGHVLALVPDVIKLDISLVRHIDTDLPRQALVTALLAFARTTSATIVAEGVETTAELACLRRLRVPAVQGYLLGRPGPLEAAPEVA